MSVLLRNVRDGVTGGQVSDTPVDLLLDAGVAPRAIDSVPDHVTVIDGDGLLALPGFTDLYGRLREPGPSRRGSLRSECTAALHAGFTRVCASPDTEPAIDATATVELVLHRAASAGAARVLPLAALTVGLDGTRLAELGTLAAAGCVAASHADAALDDTRLLHDAMAYAASVGMPLMLRARDARLGIRGCAHDGATATRLGLRGVPVAAETIALARYIELMHETGAALHVSRLSSARGVELVMRARDAGLPISADVGLAHLHCCDEDLDGFDARYASSVPFRSRADRQALRDAVRDGTIAAICSDHAPLDADASLAPFPQVEPGLSTYDRFLPMLLSLQRDADIPLERLIDAVAHAPLRCLGLAPGNDVVLIAPDATVPTDRWLSAGRNSPWFGLDGLQGAVRHVCMDGAVVPLPEAP